MDKNIDALAHDLIRGNSESLRRQAAVELGARGELNEESVRALVTSRLFDPEIRVREASSQVLATAAAQSVLAAHPNLQQEAIAAATRERPFARRVAGQTIQGEFERRRNRVSTALLLSVALLVLLTVLIYSGNATLGPLAFVLWLGVVLFAAAFTWQNWRCPSCGASFAAWSTRVDPWSARSPLSCPHCGISLK